MKKFSTVVRNGRFQNELSFLSVLALLIVILTKDLNAMVGAPEVEWHKSYNGSGEESHPHYVIQTKDFGFLMVGETGFVEDRSARIFLVKTDRLGKLLWQREFGKPGYNLGNCLAESKDGNYLVAGTLNFDAALIKVEAETGKMIWSKTWNLGSEDSFEGLALTNDGGIVLTGYRDGLAEGTFLNWGRGMVLKTSANGREEWRRDLSRYSSCGYRIQKSSSGFMLLVHPKDEESENFNLLSLDQKGMVLWAKSYGEIYWGYDQNEKGEILLSGHTRKTPLSKNLDIQIKKLNHTGEEVWTKFFGQPRGYDGKWIHDEVWGVRSTPDDGWLAVAGTGDETRRYEGRGHPSGPSGQWKVYLIKTDAKGNLDWEGVYGSSEEDWAGEDVCITADGGALVANDCGAFGFTKISPFILTNRNSNQ